MKVIFVILLGLIVDWCLLFLLMKNGWLFIKVGNLYKNKELLLKILLLFFMEFGVGLIFVCLGMFYVLD